jgi:hypothetical protein
VADTADIFILCRFISFNADMDKMFSAPPARIKWSKSLFSELTFLDAMNQMGNTDYARAFMQKKMKPIRATKTKIKMPADVCKII